MEGWSSGSGESSIWWKQYLQRDPGGGRQFNKIWKWKEGEQWEERGKGVGVSVCLCVQEALREMKGTRQVLTLSATSSKRSLCPRKTQRIETSMSSFFPQ